MNSYEEEIRETDKWIEKRKEDIRDQEREIKEILRNFSNESQTENNYKIIRSAGPQEINNTENIECTFSKEQIKDEIGKLITIATNINNYHNKVALMIHKKNYYLQLIDELPESEFSPTEKEKFENNLEEFLLSYRKLCKKRTNNKIMRHKKNIYVYEEKLIECIDRVFNSRANIVRANWQANDLFSSDTN